GGAYVPLDPAYPTDRLAFMLQDTTATAVITHAHLHTKLPAPDNCPVVCLDRDTDTLAALPTTNPAPDAGPDDLAYVIYTSGSTGTPKGVLVEHRSVANRLLGVHDNFHFGPDDAWTLFHSYAFDFSVWEIWGALTHGARLVIVDHETTRNTDAFIQLLINEHITVLNQTPSAFNLLQQQTNTHHAHQLSLRLIIFGGEALQPARLKPWWKTVGDNGPRLVNMYGITETTIHATTRNITPTDSETTTTSPIGHPLPHTEIFVLDPTGNPTPIGIPGELWISGTGLARGYLNRPELTDQHFTERKINGHTRRLYRSGDTARWLPQGELEYLGRLDNQVKIRGHRIELGEIEATLTHNKTLKTTTLTTHEDTPGNKRLIAYAVPTPGTQPTTTELHEWCRHHLPTHMIPSTFILLDTLPLTPNGKIDHKALPTPDNHRPHTHTPYTPPRTQPEEAITRIWAEVLRLDQVGIHDNFFELGGDSILSIQVISRAKRYGLHLTPRMIFQHQTIA
ncbi:non-ribosomal peptide synthetase, partial [Streptomyces sp. NPDC088846]|uniref:non-ribosomal peptide synthetase n=1 Tax=Streptomyces sp. NPDC088846 TaxID=3365908 RepID=UPI0037FA53E5